MDPVPSTSTCTNSENLPANDVGFKIPSRRVRKKKTKWTAAPLGNASTSGSLTSERSSPKKRPAESSDVPLKNKFKHLDGLDENNLDPMPLKVNTNKTNRDRHRGEKSSKQLPPPIVMLGELRDFEELAESLAKQTTDKVSFKFITDHTKIITRNRKDWDTVKGIAISKQVPFFTYTLPEDRPLETVLRGIPAGKAEKIKAAHEADDLPVQAVHPMLGPRVVQPLYKVNFNNTINMGRLSKVAYVLHCRVYWRRYRLRSGFTQCHRCQDPGHAARNCHCDPSCVKCAGDHFTETYTKPKTEPAKCVNCGGDHPANYRQCEVIVKYREKIEKRRQKQKPAPVSKENARSQNQTPPENSSREFPPLRSRQTAPPAAAPASAPAPAPVAQQTLSLSIKQQDALKEIQSIYAAVDIFGLLDRARKFKAAIDATKNELEKFEVLKQFGYI